MLLDFVRLDIRVLFDGLDHLVQTLQLAIGPTSDTMTTADTFEDCDTHAQSLGGLFDGQVEHALQHLDLYLWSTHASPSHLRGMW